MHNFKSFFLSLASIASGIGLELYFPSLENHFLVITLLSGVLFLLNFANIRQKYRLLSTLVLSFFFGQATIFLHVNKLKNDQKSLSGRYNYIVGIVQEKNTLQGKIFKEYFIVKLEGGKFSKFPIGTRLNSSLGIYAKNSTSCGIGDKILIKKIAIKPFMHNQGHACIELIKQNIAATAFIYSPYQIKILEKAQQNVFEQIRQYREFIYEKIQRKLSTLAAPYIGLLFFGNKQHEQLSDLQNFFSFWGLSHYLARSGLHIVLLIGIWLIFLKFLPVHIKIKHIIFFFFLMIYTFFSWNSISFSRALFLFFFTQGGIMLYRKTMPFHLLSIICIGMLLFNPALIFYLDFQLTFGLTFGLLGFSRFLSEHKNTVQLSIQK